MTDLSYEEIHRLLSTPGDRVPGNVTRRRFLQGTLAAGSMLALPSIFDGLAEAASPVGPSDGILIVLHFGGGNDGLNMVVPRTDGAYRTLRGGLAITEPLALAGTTDFGFHPALTKLRARYDDGKVAIVHGVGQSTVTDLSHFSSTASWMAGTAGNGRTTGWLGRWLDGVAESADGLRAVTLGSSIPLHLQGQQAVVTAMDTGGDLFGADRREPWMTSVYDAVSAFGSGATGKGHWADRLATAGRSSIQLATDLTPVFTPELPNDSLTSQLTLVARLINANLGIRVFNTSLGSFDTHDNQLYRQDRLLADLDSAIDAFYATLAPQWRTRTAFASFSEFGRRPQANASNGTDHATSSVMLVIGDNVKGGQFGAHSPLSQLDDRGNPLVNVDYRSYYASLLGGWLGADTNAVLGGSYPDLGLFTARPGGTPQGPVTTGPWVPFASAAVLVEQQYLDFMGRVGDPGGVSYWAGRLTSGRTTISGLIASFLDSAEFGRSVAPAARLALVAFGATPLYDDLMAWAAQVRSGQTVAQVAAGVCAHGTFTSRHGAKNDRDFVTSIYAEAVGRPASVAFVDDWVGRLGAATATRADLVAHLASDATVIDRYRPQVDVLMTYAGLLRRRPDPGGWSYWVPKVSRGTSIQRLIAQFFNSSEYRNRFS